MDDFDLPANYEAERRLLGAFMVATPAVRNEIAERCFADWFHDEWHREVFLTILANRDLDGQEFAEALLNAKIRKNWDRPFEYLASLIVDQRDARVCGEVALWRIYATDLELAYERRTGCSFFLSKLQDLIHEHKADCLLESVEPRTHVRRNTPRQPAKFTQ